MGLFDWLRCNTEKEEQMRSEQRSKEKQLDADHRFREETYRSDQRFKEEQKRIDQRLAERKQDLAEKEAYAKHIRETFVNDEEKKLAHMEMSHRHHNETTRMVQDNQNTRLRYILIGLLAITAGMLPLCYLYPESTISKVALALIVGALMYFLWYVQLQDRKTASHQQRQEQMKYALDLQCATTSSMAITGAQNTFVQATLMQLKYD